MTANGVQRRTWMGRNTWNVLRNISIAGAFIGVLVLLSALNARRTCEPLVREEVGPRHYGTRFAINPGRHITGWTQPGAHPGWVVIYAEKGSPLGMAFHVGVFGKILGEGTPRI